jgi:acyl carrier protein
MTERQEGEMTEIELQEKLRAFIVSEFLLEQQRDSIDLDDDLLSSGTIDSMGVMELVAYMEESLGVRIDDEDIVPETFRTLRALTELAVAKRHAASA